MKRLLALFLMLLVLPSASSLRLPSVSASDGENVSYLLKSTVQYVNPSQNGIWNLTEREEDLTISLFMNNTWQTVELINATLPIEKRTNDNDGNPVALLRPIKSALYPKENLSFTVWYRIITKPRMLPTISETESQALADIPQWLVTQFTKQEGSFQTTNPTLRDLARSLKGSETRVLTIVKNFTDWIRSRISYPKSRHENPYYPNQTYARLEGDCDDQALLLITLLRIVGIPSFLQIGGIYMPNYFDNATNLWDGHVSVVQRQIGWHGWAVVYVPPWGWLPVDLTYVRNPGDPLGSIKSGAVTEQDTFQYMNITGTDYVASSFEGRAFLAENGFRVHVEDQMILITEQEGGRGFTTVIRDLWLPIVLLSSATFVLTVSLFISRRLRKKVAKERVPPPPEMHL